MAKKPKKQSSDKVSTLAAKVLGGSKKPTAAEKACAYYPHNYKNSLRSSIFNCGFKFI